LFRSLSSHHATCRLAAASVLIGTLACSGGAPSEPPLATPSVSVNPSGVVLGGPVEVTYRFAVASDAPNLGEDLLVFVHFVDNEGRLLWTDDHEPPTPSMGWAAGQTVEYTRTVFVPAASLYIGPARILVGLYSREDGRRVPLDGTDVGQLAYAVGTLELLPQADTVFMVPSDGWYAPEVAETGSLVEWQWTSRTALLTFRNPRRAATFFLHLDGRPDLVEGAQVVTISIGEAILDQFTLESSDAVVRKIPIAAAEFGEADLVELTIDAGQTFVPAQVAAGNGDTRELGVRVFHSFLQPL